MNPDIKNDSGRSQREIFLEALQIRDGKKRAAFLETSCCGNLALQQELEKMLDQEKAMGGFLETPAIAREGTKQNPFGPAEMDRIGDRVGRYKILERIGEGGTGIVYLAVQEEPVRRQVALKILRVGMDTPEVIARFEAERQALAMMDHPNIARVYDAGTTDSGQPFFVMELVRGAWITHYCDEFQLSPRQRLELFIQVCRAVQHAHQKGIIHRDIKPSNVLVTAHDGSPMPKVIDFGIAKAIEQRLTEKTVFTQFTSFIGTPAYMSPEQAEMSGKDIDTRSDIYALGVLLYELLTGKTPFEAETLHLAGLDECRRMICEQDPPRPSTRLTTLPDDELTTTAGQCGIEVPRLVQLLKGDLDWIILKCLEKDRNRRYDTPASLVMDLQNYLEDQPVTARPPSQVYRMRKVLQRHGRAIAAGVLLAASLIAGTAISTHQAIRAKQAEQWAIQEEKAARLNEYIADINLTQRSLAEGHYGRAVQLLEKHLPEPGKPDLRGFEWRYLWQVSRGGEHLSLPGQDGPIHSVALSPDGHRLVIGLPDQFSVWDARLHTLITNVPMGIDSMAFSPDGTRLFAAHPNLRRPPGARPERGSTTNRPRRPGTGGPQFERPEGDSRPGPSRREPRESRPRPPRGPRQDVTVRVWNTRDWTENKSLAGKGAPIVLTQDGGLLATHEDREGVRLWDTDSWQEVNRWREARPPMVFSPDGRTLAATGANGITLWPSSATSPGVVLKNSTNLFSRRRPGPGFLPEGDMLFSPDGQWIIATRNNLSERGIFVLGIWNIATGEELALPEDPDRIEHTAAITSLAFSPDGQMLATASMDYSIRLWNFTNRRLVDTLQGHLSEVWTLAFSPDGQSLVSGAKDGSVKVWPVQRRKEEDMIPGQWREIFAISTDGLKIATLDTEESLVILNLVTRDPELKLEQDDESRRPRRPRSRLLALSDDFRTVAEIEDDQEVRLLNTETGTTTTVGRTDERINLLALSPDASHLVTGEGGRRQLRWWDLREGTNHLLETEVSQALFSSDGRILATFQRDNQITLWDVATRAPMKAWVNTNDMRLETAALSPDGQILAAACADDVVRLWNARTGAFLGECVGHKQDVSSVAFSPDGQTLATSSDDRTLRLWNVATHQELMAMRRLGGRIRTLLFSPDDHLLIGRTSSILSNGGLKYYRAPIPVNAGNRNAVKVASHTP